jgi:hypothetical protein
MVANLYDTVSLSRMLVAGKARHVMRHCSYSIQRRLLRDICTLRYHRQMQASCQHCDGMIRRYAHRQSR